MIYCDYDKQISVDKTKFKPLLLTYAGIGAAD
jgi:hypothetical protein